MNKATTLLVAATLLAGGCSQCGGSDTAVLAAGEQLAAGSVTDSAAEAARADSLARLRAETEEVRALIRETIHFDFDRSTIRPGRDSEILQQKLAVMQANPALTIQVTGHCDERGPAAYNMALGERRARATMNWFTDRGIAANRISIRSMGEEQPAATGHDESAWSQNRRTEFTITDGGDQLRRP